MARDFQHRAYGAAAQDFIQRTGRCNLFAPPGFGKTGIVLSTIDAGLIAGYDRPTLVLAPLRVARGVWTREAEKWNQFAHIEIAAIVGNEDQRRKALRRDVAVHTINYENLPWLLDEIGDWWRWGTVIADECFVAGTPVATPRGSTPINRIRVGDIVSTVAGPKKVLNVFRKTAVQVFNVYLRDGTKIQCTGNHPFWTANGWVEAKHLAGQTVMRRKSLCNLQHRVRDFSGASERHARALLLAFVQHEKLDSAQVRGLVASAPDQGPEQVAGRKQSMEQGDTNVRDYARESLRRGGGQNVADRSDARRQRAGDERPRKAAEHGPETGVGLQLCGSDKAAHPRRLAEVAAVLQTRLCVPAGKARAGSGRLYAPHAQRANQGSEENVRFDSVGVERVEAIECRSERHVWDIEVDGAHHYYAHGVLVHNSSKLRSFRTKQGSKRARALARVAHDKVGRWVNLTGTPCSNGLQNLWGQQWFVDGGQRLGSSYAAFTDRWFRRSFNGFSYTPTESADTQIHRAIADVSMSLKAEDWFDVRAPVVSTRVIELPPAARRHYRELEKQMLTQLESMHDITAVNAAALTVKCLQICSGAAYINDKGDWRAVHDEKLDALDEIIEETGGAPVLVSYEFKSDKARILARYPRDGADLATREGLARFLKGDVRVGVAHPASLAHGVDGLQHVCNTIVHFSQGWNLENYLQINERIGPVRQLQAGLDRAVFVHHIIAANTLDTEVLARRESKRSVQDALLDYLRLRK